MIKHFVCQIKQFYADCPKSDNWFGCHAVTSKGRKMIANRSLLYTAVTRAKECVCIIGNRSCVDSYIYAIPSIRAFTLAEELCEESL